MEPDEPQVRAAEVVGAVSLATDLGTGQPLEHTLRTAILAVRLGDLAGASPQELRDAYYVSLLHSFGCTSDAPEATELYGDDIVPRAAFALVDGGNPDEVGAFFTAAVGTGRPPEVREAMVAETLANALPLAQATFALHCEVAQRFASWLGFGSGILEALAFVFERWDGHGLPAGVAGEAIPLPARLLHVARDISVFLSAARRRRGARGDRAARGRARTSRRSPRSRSSTSTSSSSGSTRRGSGTRRSPPSRAPVRWMAGDEIDAAFGVVGRVHRPQVALAARARRGRGGAGRGRGLAPGLHAGGRRPPCGAPRSRSTSAASACRTRSGRSPGRSGSATGSACACTRTSPSARSRTRRRWPRWARWPARTTSGSTAPATTARRSRRGSRPRPASSPPPTPTRRCASRGRTGPRSTRRRAEAQLLREAEEGRLCPEAVDAVLAAAGHRVARRPRELPAGLTERELEVLLALVAGQTNQRIGESLGISAKTAGHHVQHIYEKAGVRSRAAATVWAFEHSLVHAA